MGALDILSDWTHPVSVLLPEHGGTLDFDYSFNPMLMLARKIHMGIPRWRSSREARDDDELGTEKRGKTDVTSVEELLLSSWGGEGTTLHKCLRCKRKVWSGGQQAWAKWPIDPLNWSVDMDHLGIKLEKYPKPISSVVQNIFLDWAKLILLRRYCISVLYFLWARLGRRSPRPATASDSTAPSSLFIR